MRCNGCECLLIDQYGDESSELFAHEINGGLFVVFASCFERHLALSELGVVSHAAEGGLEQRGSGDAYSAFGDFGGAFPFARLLDPGVGAEEGLELACYLFLAAVLQAFGRDEGQDGGVVLAPKPGMLRASRIISVPAQGMSSWSILRSICLSCCCRCSMVSRSVPKSPSSQVAPMAWMAKLWAAACFNAAGGVFNDVGQGLTQDLA